MNVLWQIVLVPVCFVPCLWFALFVLSWRDGRDCAQDAEFPEPDAEAPEPLESPMPRHKPIDYFTILPLYWLIWFLIWPAFVGHWLGRRRRGQ